MTRLYLRYVHVWNLIIKQNRKNSISVYLWHYSQNTTLLWAGDILSAGMIKFKQDYFRFGRWKFASLIVLTRAAVNYFNLLFSCLKLFLMSWIEFDVRNVIMMDGTCTLTFFKEIDDINELIWYNYLLMSYYQSTNQIYFCVDKK